MEGHETRWAEVVIIYEGENITKDVAPYLLSFTYTDNASDKADDISFSLEDRKRLWIDDWFPTKGNKVKASIVVHEWDAPDKTESLPCRTFEVDEVSVSGSPNTVTIKAISTLVSKPMRQEKHPKAWGNIKLSTIAGDMANKNSLKLFWDSKKDPLFERRDQVEMSDIEFFSGLAKDYGIAVKITDTQLVCYGAEEYEEKSPVGELKFGDKKLLSWGFSSKAAGTYKAAHLQYHDPVKNTNIDLTEESEDETEGTGRTLEANQKPIQYLNSTNFQIILLLLIFVFLNFLLQVSKFLCASKLKVLNFVLLPRIFQENLRSKIRQCLCLRGAL